MTAALQLLRSSHALLCTACHPLKGLWRVAGNGSLIEDFVARSGTRFVVQSRNGSKGDCETFYFSGANANYMVRRPRCPYRQQPCWARQHSE